MIFTVVGKKPATPEPLETAAPEALSRSPVTQIPGVPARRWYVVPLQDVDAPYPQLHVLADESFTALRKRVIADAGWDALASLEGLLSASNPEIVFNRTDQHGFTVVEITGTGVKATLHQIPSAEVTHDYSSTPGDLAGKFTTTDCPSPICARARCGRGSRGSVEWRM